MNGGGRKRWRSEEPQETHQDFLFFLSFGLSEKRSQANTTNPIATPVTANHVPSLSISASCVEVLVTQRG